MIALFSSTSEDARALRARRSKDENQTRWTAARLAAAQRPSMLAAVIERCRLIAFLASLSTTFACTDFEGVHVAKSSSNSSSGPCDSVVPPGPPVRPIPSTSTAAKDFTVAVHENEMGDDDGDGGTPAYARMGYNLDGVCTTTSAASRSCVSPPQTEFYPLDPTDGPGGRDNMFGKLIHRVSSDRSVSDSFNKTIRDGTLSLVIHVTGYNGLPNDDAVVVSVYGATMNPVLAPEAGSATGSASADSGRGPTWDGDDGWYAYPDWVSGGLSADAGANAFPPPQFKSQYAYVNAAELVAYFATVDIGSGLHAVNLYMTATLVEAGGTWALRNGTIAGAIPLNGFLGIASLIRDPTNPNTFLCTTSSLYPAYKSYLCSLGDIMQNYSSEPNTSCDAVSVAWEFFADPAKLVGESRDPPPGACSAATSPLTDTCGSSRDH